ncbi:laminin subunit gamma-1-like [Watersipora subatra]|uniref:laminin subunit gamma-1-like n=1 Tax=Watersipora subatra TaxID=2589382 RepID=UPI00355BE1B0
MAHFSLFLSLITLSLYSHFIDAQQNPNSPCYDINGLPRRCEPVFSNIAYGLPAKATNTCGQEVTTDDSGRPYLPRKVDSFRTFYRQTGASGNTKYRDYCDQNSADPSKRHPAQNMVDLDSSSSRRTWWQSITLYESKERNLGDMVTASITLHLGKAYDITYIRLRFQSPRPESFAIFKKTTEMSEWEPYHYYSATCRSTYNLTQEGMIDTPTRAVCTGDYSAITPLSGGNVAFGTLDKRPNAYEFDRNPVLQEFVTATAIQIRLTRLNTFGDEVFEDTSVLQSYYYAISDISVGAKCKCNGHANECVQSASEDGVQRVVCVCQHYTTGADCGQCLRTHNDRPWAPASITQPSTCQECQCNGRSDLCYFNQTLYERTGSGGYCEGCRDFTDGPHCELCRRNYYRSDPRDVCRPCNCDTTGSVQQQCNSYGQCECKPGVTGVKCDKCEANYYDFDSYGCRDCDCKKAGSFDNQPYCDSRNGQCVCKENVEGQDCSVCKPGYFNLDLDNKFGCIACFCNGKTSECTSASGYSRAYINSFFDTGNEDWRVGDIISADSSSSFNGITEDVGVNSVGYDGQLYFYAPQRFLGNQQFSYDQFLEFNLRIGESEGRPSQRDVILEGNGRSIYLPLFAQQNPLPSVTTQHYKFRLNEHSNYGWTPTLSALEFQRLLSDLTAIKIRGNFNNPGAGFLDDVRLHTANYGPQIGDLSSIERCKCPEQYIGQHCELCAPGYKRLVPFGGKSLECVPCECNGHSDTCDPESGACICQHDTVGHNCEKCKEGWYGNALLGTPTDCTVCPCPGQGACYEQLDMSVSCLNCPEGYSGDLCDMCEDGFYGDLSSGDDCSLCDCSGNVDSNAVGNCDTTTGICLKCIYNTTGDHCENCLSGFYGNATADEKGDCKPCECNMYGTNATMADACEENDGQCACLPYVTGRQCDECFEGYYNLESTEGCIACLCDPTGSSSTKCDIYTGQCMCKPGIGGLRCDICMEDYYGFSSSGCDACNCLEIGSASQQCDDSGQCVCKDETRITGQLCDTCHENKYNLTAGCLDCPACYNLVQDAVKDIRENLDNLTETLKNINENPNVADDADFTRQLDALSDEIDRMLKEAQDLQMSGGSVPNDIQNIEDDLRKLQDTVIETRLLIEISNQNYQSIDPSALSKRISDLTGEVSDVRADFLKTSDNLYSQIGLALGKNGNEQRSQNMTAMAQQSAALLKQQQEDSEKIVMTADNANEISNNGYSLALAVVASPDDLRGKLEELNDRIIEGQENLETANATAQRALAEAIKLYDDAIGLLNDVRSIVVPSADAPAEQEAQAILEDALQYKIKIEELLSNYSSLLNDTRETLSQAEDVYNRTYAEQQITDAMMAEVDVALEKARQAINAPASMLASGRAQLRLLQESDQNVKLYKERALEALKKIPEIEAILDEANNVTSEAQDAIEGATQVATEAKTIAMDAVITANEASENAAKILAEAQKAKEAADAESAITDMHEKNLMELEKRINMLGTQEEEKKLVEAVLTEAEKARRLANDTATELKEDSEKVDDILAALSQLPTLNTTELDRLEMEIEMLEADYEASQIDSQLKTLTEFSSLQRLMGQTQANSLTELVAAVANIQLIVETIPDNSTCFTPPLLEPTSPDKKKRRRQRKLRKRLRH